MSGGLWTAVLGGGPSVSYGHDTSVRMHRNTVRHPWTPLHDRHPVAEPPLLPSCGPQCTTTAELVADPFVQPDSLAVTLTVIL